MRQLIVLALGILSFAAVAGSAVEDQKPQWHEAGKLLTIFGNVERPGSYTLTDQPMSLAQLVVSAGMRPGNGVVVILQRQTAAGTKTIEVDATRLKEDGSIPLEANDAIQVTAPKPVAGPNQVLFDYLGEPVALPARMVPAYTEEGLVNALRDAAQGAGVSLTKVEVDASEFPFLVGVVCPSKGDIDKLKEQIRKVPAYSYGGGVGGDTTLAMNLVPYSAYPAESRERIARRMILREAILFDKVSKGR